MIFPEDKFCFGLLNLIGFNYYNFLSNFVHYLCTISFFWYLDRNHLIKNLGLRNVSHLCEWNKYATEKVYSHN